jgi:hypothetical protein
MYHIATKDQTGRSITIRAAGSEDVEALNRLAQRDSRAVPEGELLVALVDGEARAAISLVSGKIIADPFQRTEELVEMLTLHASEPSARASSSFPPGPAKHRLTTAAS